MTQTQRQRIAPRLALEALVIILSILAAFALDRWWDVRRAARDERQVLEGLRSEFKEARAELETYRGLQERIRTSVRSTGASLRDARTGGSTFAVVPDTALGWVYISPTARPSLGTLAGLLASARLSIVRDPELRYALAGWSGVFDELAEEEGESRIYVMNQVDPVLRARVDVAPFRTIILRQADGTLTEAELGGNTRLPVDSETIGVFAGRMFYLDHGIDEYQPVLEHIDRILQMIDASLEDAPTDGRVDGTSAEG